MGIKNFAIILFLVLAGADAQGQNIFSSLNLNESKGDKLFSNFSYKEAISVYTQVLSKDEANNSVKLKIAESYRMLNDNLNAEHWYSQVIQEKDLVKPEQKLHYAQVLAANMKYEEAKYWFSEYQKENGNDGRPSKNINSIENLGRYFADSSQFVLKNISLNSSMSDFGPTWYKNGLVFVSARMNDRAIRRVFNRDDSNFLDLYYSEEREDGSHETPELFHKSINTKLHEGPSIYYDNYSKLIFTGNSMQPGENGVTGLSLYQTTTSDAINWTEPRSINLNNKEYSVGHPALTSDNKTLFFSSNMPGGKGGVDIYKSEWSNDSWTTPVNVELVNTEGDEMFPFIYSDSILYYSSNGSGGLGGLDIYSRNLNSSTNPKNVGYPLNSNGDDFGIIIANDGASGYLASNRAGGKGDDDIYYFARIQSRLNLNIVENETTLKLDDVLIKSKEGLIDLPDKYSDVNGTAIIMLNATKNYVVKMAKRGYYPAKILIPAEEVEDIMSIDVPLSKIPNGKEEELDSLIASFLDGKPGSEDDGLFERGSIFEVQDGKIDTSSSLSESGLSNEDKSKEALSKRVNIYEIGNITKTGQLFFKIDDKLYIYGEKLLKPLDPQNEPLPIVVHLPKYSQAIDEYLLSKNYSSRYYKINHILFDFNKDIIRNDASVHLDNLIHVLIEYPEINIEMSGHTDSRGSRIYNEKLSKRRVESALNYLIGEGISPKRIKLMHFGEDRLSNGCDDLQECPEFEHQLNRRVEIKILFE